MKNMLVLMMNLLCICYGLAAVFYFQEKLKKLHRAAYSLAVIGSIVNLLLLFMRIFLAGRLPLSNGAEFLLSFTWIMVLFFLIREATRHSQGTGGLIMLMAALFIIAVRIMSVQITEINPLAPALKSPWLTIHVLTVAVAYAGFTLAAGMAFRQLSKRETEQKEDGVHHVIAGSFMMLSLSIIFGAFWAEQAWGSYWSWDPKETWALITWIIYAVYLHLYRKPDWQGRNGNYIVILGFVFMLFTFFGVNYLLTGLHSYA